MTTGPLYAFVHDGSGDPDERLENALLYRALRRRLGPRMPGYAREADIPKSVRAVFGRASPLRLVNGREQCPLVYPHPRVHTLPYWEDPAFLAAAGRKIGLFDLPDAAREVAAMHARGEAAFVKATRPKFFAQLVEPGTGLIAALDSLSYSLCDAADCLLVQEAVRFEHEYRVFVVAGEAVTGAGCIEDRSPAENRDRFDTAMASRRSSEHVTAQPGLTAAYQDFAERFVAGRTDLTCTLDLATVDGRIRVIEMNPLQLGRVGLFACDVQALADAVLAQVRPAVESTSDRVAP